MKVYSSNIRDGGLSLKGVGFWKNEITTPASMNGKNKPKLITREMLLIVPESDEGKNSK